MAKAVRESGMGFGAPSSRDMGTPAEWLSGGAGYAGIKRWKKENKFLSRHCRTLAKAKGVRCGASWGIRAAYGTVRWWVWLGWRSAVSGACGFGEGAWSFLET